MSASVDSFLNAVLRGFRFVQRGDHLVPALAIGQGVAPRQSPKRGLILFFIAGASRYTQAGSVDEIDANGNIRPNAIIKSGIYIHRFLTCFLEIPGFIKRFS